MSQFVTLELPDALAETIREEARQTGQSVEAVLLKRLQQTYQTVIPYNTLISGTTYEVSFPVTDDDSAADLMAFWKTSQKDGPAS
jgi:hypothetical protein